MTYKLAFRDGTEPSTDWFAASQVELLVACETAQVWVWDMDCFSTVHGSAGSISTASCCSGAASQRGTDEDEDCALGSPRDFWREAPPPAPRRLPERISEIDCSLDSSASFGHVGAAVAAALQRVADAESQLNLRKQCGRVGRVGLYAIESVEQLRKARMEEEEEAIAPGTWADLKQKLAAMDGDELLVRPAPRAFASQERQALRLLEDEHLRRSLSSMHEGLQELLARV